MKTSKRKYVTILIAALVLSSTIGALLIDTDGDGLWNSHEALIGTNAHSRDSDDDGLTDSEEVYRGVDGYITDPLNVDSDGDGLSDYEEVKEFGSSPNKVDTDDDGARDPIDGTPDGVPDIMWRKEFLPGMIRFSLPYEVYSVEGISAKKYTWDLLSNSCRFVKDDTKESTKTSSVTGQSVLASINADLEESGEYAYRAVEAEYEGILTRQYLDLTHGDCDWLSWNKYKIRYSVNNHIHEVHFTNFVPTQVHDSKGSTYSYAIEDIPINPYQNQLISWQLRIREGNQGFPHSGAWIDRVPGIVFTLYRGANFMSRLPVLTEIVPGLHLGNGVYEFNLRIGADVAIPSNVVAAGGGYRATLVTSPVWIEGNTDDNRIVTAMESSHLNMVSVNHRQIESVVHIIVRRGHLISKTQSLLPEDLNTLEQGRHVFGDYEVCVIKHTAFNGCQDSSSYDALVIISSSEEGVDSVLDGITWGPPGIWYEEQKDELGNVLRTFSNLVDVMEIDSQLYCHMKNRTSGPSAKKDATSRSVLVGLNKRLGIDGRPRFNSFGVLVTKKISWLKEGAVKSISVGSRMKSMGTSTSPEKSALSKGLGDPILNTLKTAKIGTILVTNGREAWLAYSDGDRIQGHLYAAKGSIGTFSVLAEDKTLGTFGVGGRILEKVPAARLAMFVLATISTGYVVSKMNAEEDPLTNRILVNQAFSSSVDVVFLIVLGLGPIYLGWSIGVSIAYVLAPDDVTARIMSSPGSFLTFMFTYFFTNEIPVEFAQNALQGALRRAAESAKNAVERGRYATVILP